eukprot:3400506-Amphidinium_carterae.1
MFAHMVKAAGMEDKLLFAKVGIPIIGDEYTPSQAAFVRQLHTECLTMAFEDLKRRTERTEGDAPRKVPHIEKAGRMK